MVYMLVSQVLSPKGKPTFPSSSGMVLGKIVQITYGQARLESLPQAVGGSAWKLEMDVVKHRLNRKTTGGNCQVIVEWTPAFLVDSCKQVHLGSSTVDITTTRHLTTKGSFG